MTDRHNTASPVAGGASAVMPGRQAVAGQILRDKLLDRLEHAGNVRLILIRAAAGFGKSTLLQQYRERCVAAGMQVLWLDMETTDNDLTSFAGRLETGIRALDLGHAADGTDDGADAAESIHLLLEYLHCRERPFAILLDEFEAIQNPAVLSFVQQLLAALPAAGRLVIASRTTPAIGIGRIRARGQLLEIKPDALRFSMAETVAYLRDMHRLKLGDNEIARLYECTEGWAAALGLAVLSLHGRDDPAAFIESFSGSHLELASYLANDILAQQSRECRDFLLQTSVLRQLSAPLCDALTGRSDSRQMIEYLLHANLFLFPVDEEQRWFRYHTLFASFLADARELRFPGRAVALHQAAAQWHLAEGLPVQAIDHLLRAGDTREAAGALASHFPALFERGHTRLLLRWLEQIPVEQLDEQPGLVLVYAWVLTLARRYDEALQLVGRSASPVECDLIRCMVLAVTDQVEEAYELGLKLNDRVTPNEHFAYGTLANTLAYCMLATGRIDEARRLLSNAILHATQRGSGFMKGVSVSIEGNLDLIQGRLGSALARVQDLGLSHWGSAGGKLFGGKLALNVIRAVTLYESGQLDEVELLLSECQPYAQDSGPLNTPIVIHLLLARIAWSRGDRPAWQQCLLDLEQIGRNCGSSRILCSVWIERARVAALDGRLESAAQAMYQAERHGDWERPGTLFHSNDTDSLTIARLRLAIAQGQHALATEALSQAIDAAEGQRLLRRVLKLRLLLALALDGAGQEGKAFAVLGEALRFASHEGFVATFLEEGVRLADLLQRWGQSYRASASALGIAPRFLGELLRRVGTRGETGVRAVAGEGRDILTEREREVMLLAAEGCAIRDIAERMRLSLHTVKTHLRNINGKLGSHGRMEAIAIARSRGLLD
ncbi:HTH-type transcriptional regulator MalT [compost metagenome]